MKINAKKCHVLKMHKSEKRPKWNYKLEVETIKIVKEVQQVIIQDTLPPQHVNRIFRITYNMLQNMSGFSLYE